MPCRHTQSWRILLNSFSGILMYFMLAISAPPSNLSWKFEKPIILIKRHELQCTAVKGWKGIVNSLLKISETKVSWYFSVVEFSLFKNMNFYLLLFDNSTRWKFKFKQDQTKASIATKYETNNLRSIVFIIIFLFEREPITKMHKSSSFF